MKKETKNALYSMLDLIDLLTSVEFLKADIDKVNGIRREILNLVSEKNEKAILEVTSDEILGILPTLLLDTKKFESPKDILKFAEICLGIEIKPYWLKRSRAEIIGIIINEVNNQNSNQLNKFLKAWNEFNTDTKTLSNGVNQNNSNNDFMNNWFEFFDAYRGLN